MARPSRSMPVIRRPGPTSEALPVVRRDGSTSQIVPKIRRSTEEPIQVLLTDDENLNRRLIRRYLERAGMVVVEAVDGLAALEALEQLGGSVDVVVLDLLMPGMNGEEVLAHMQAHPQHRTVPVLIASNMSAMDSRGELLTNGASDFLDKPVRSTDLIARVRSLARLRRARAAVRGAEAALMSIGLAAEARDPSRAGHCERLALLSGALGDAFGVDAEQVHALRMASFLHDIGMLSVPESILLEPAQLSGDEWAAVRRHPIEGVKMLRSAPSLAAVLPIVRHHHERWDGSGYPDGLAGSRIPLEARLFRLADVYDSLRSRRPWRPACGAEEARALLLREEGRGWWEPALLKRGLDVLAQTPLPPKLDWDQSQS